MKSNNSLKPAYIHGLGVLNALGANSAEVASALLTNQRDGMVLDTQYLLANQACYVGKVAAELPVIEGLQHNCRNNRLAIAALDQFRPAFDRAVERFGRDRIAVVTGTSTSGVDCAEGAFEAVQRSGSVGAGFHYSQAEIGGLSEFLKHHLNLAGPAYTISTACSSSGRALLSAQRLLSSGLVDAVIAGGVDSLCQLTLNGFNALDSLSADLCRPMAKHRNGISIGEGAALFLLTREPSDVAVVAVGDSSDAHHISAPCPDGSGAEEAMRKALSLANIAPDQIDYINLHGTATPLNDAMESAAVYRLFGADVPCSSTKSMIGHTLGAAAAQEVGLCYLALMADEPFAPAHNDLAAGERDTDLAPIKLATGEKIEGRYVLSNSFAFGGNNVSVILAKQQRDD
ncbi:3-oxoacyl-[acyl-carrier-protein] synthase 2 [Sinobacterium norvegicum]|uniref:3-oxoacyl-[acyl-carrier-protein] synthase 2 n=1 Tax=Sinobacterium norvegicum TaxID=1641715 RepID=A0ABM9AE81_9GAMM|nr:beta-ketoacyl-[acyl-carrier-protein] synthase family protein [Sinobacterium norvegicum]CAH0991510.1 3-oxoacyl-[acyl-carrier-protein] synthase 2 [Sinobacterium norvegicum]